MLKCHICGKYGPYTAMMDYTVYSVHPKCEHKLSVISSNVKEFQNCSICKNKNDIVSTIDLRDHLIANHSKEALVDLILDRIC